MSLLDQSSVTGGGLDPYNALFVNIDNMWTERFENYDCLVSEVDHLVFQNFLSAYKNYSSTYAKKNPQKSNGILSVWKSGNPAFRLHDAVVKKVMLDRCLNVQVS